MAGATSTGKRKKTTKAATTAVTPEVITPSASEIEDSQAELVDEESESSSDEEDGEEGKDSRDEKELLLALDPKTTGEAKRKLKGVAGKQDNKAVIYLGHIPFGFFEEQMRGFFTQFGTVTRLRLSRSKKTTRSRGFAFIEFEDREVAEIVAETMHNYLLFDKLLQCHVMEPEKVHANLFRNSHRQIRRVPRAKIAAMRHNAPRSEQSVEKLQRGLLRKDSRKRKKLAALGIDYEYPGYSKSDEAISPPPKKIKSKKAKTPAAKQTPAQAKVVDTAKATPAKISKVAKLQTPSTKKVADKAKATPAKAKATPAKAKATPAKAKATPAKAKATPAKAKATPAKAKATPGNKSKVAKLQTPKSTPSAKKAKATPGKAASAKKSAGKKAK